RLEHLAERRARVDQLVAVELLDDRDIGDPLAIAVALGEDPGREPEPAVVEPQIRAQHLAVVERLDPADVEPLLAAFGDGLDVLLERPGPGADAKRAALVVGGA